MKIKPAISTILPVIGLLLLTACSQEQATMASDNRRLELSVGIDQPADLTRAATQVTSTYFPTGTQLGITVQKTNGTTYPSHEHTNVLFSAKSTGSSQAWGSTGIDLTSEAARVSAYYPYDSSFDPSAIAITCDDHTDWMYCPWKTTASNNGIINEDNRTVRLTMKHAQAIIKYQLINVNYTNEGKIYRLDIQGKFGRKGVLNSYTGTLSDVDETAFISEPYTTPLDIKTTGASNQWYVLPTPGAGEQDVILIFYIDGVEYRTAIKANLEQGKVYTFNLRMNDTFLSVASVQCEGWVDDQEKTAAITPYTPPTPYDGVLMYSDDNYDYYWAEYNVGGSLTEPYGDFFRLGETEPFTSSSVPYGFADSGQTYISGTEYDAATVLMGNGWQLPTIDDWIALAQNCSPSYYDETACGYILVSTAYPTHQMTIHCAGFANQQDGHRISDGFLGYYWADYVEGLYGGSGWGKIYFESFRSESFAESVGYYSIVSTPSNMDAISIRAIRKVAKN